MADAKPKSPTLDAKSVPGRRGTMYPDKFKPLVAGREKRALGNAFGLQNFGVNLVKLEPGAQSALRHWHTQQDEFVWMVEGEAVLVTDAGETVLKPGMCAGFPKGKPDGHHIVNRSQADAWYLGWATAAPATPRCIPTTTCARNSPRPTNSRKRTAPRIEACADLLASGRAALLRLLGVDDAVAAAALGLVKRGVGAL
jgi:uncharacterized cupin superfamily protein